MPEIYRWFAIRVRSRSEKLTAAALESRGVEVCAALSRQRRIWSDRETFVELPLFPGYVFARIDANRRQNVVSATGVVSIVGFGGQLSPVEDSEMEAIQAIVRAKVTARNW